MPFQPRMMPPPRTTEMPSTPSTAPSWSRFAISTMIPPPRFSAGRSVRLAPVLDLDERDAVHAAAGEREVAVARHRDVPHDAAAGRDRPRLEFLGLRVEADRKSTRLNSSHTVI